MGIHWGHPPAVSLYQQFPGPGTDGTDSGRFRINNFLLFQLAYAELYFTNVRWPDFRKGKPVWNHSRLPEPERRLEKQVSRLKNGNFRRTGPDDFDSAGPHKNYFPISLTKTSIFTVIFAACSANWLFSKQWKINVLCFRAPACNNQNN